MTAFTVVLILLGVLISLVGGIMQLVAAFRESVGWGLACLFLAPASLIFLILHWAEAKKGFFVGLVGTAMIVGGAMSSEPLRTAVANGSGGRGKAPFSLNLSDFVPRKGSAGAQKDLSAQIQEKRDSIDQLETEFGKAGVALVAQYQTLSAQTEPTEPVAKAKYEADKAAYKAQNDAQKQRQKDIATMREDLENLLAERSKTQPRPTASPSSPSFPGAPAPRTASTGNKRVIMYTTSTCPACRAAKEYFARKGVSYEERDVNTSAGARDEFRHLGGSGVPLILVGNEKMEGFSAQRLDQML